MSALPLILVAVPVGLLAYSYALYPALLKLAAVLRPRQEEPGAPAEWPTLTITVPSYNESRSIAATLESILGLDYPADRRQILVISDASTDGTDEVVQTFADRGVELLRLPARRGKTAAENAAAARIRGEIVVNTDATIRIQPGSLKQLVAAFADPTVGVASGRDISVGDFESRRNQAESGYVGYEMLVRRLETQVGGIVGASGCFFGIRRSLYVDDFPEQLSRDFASCLIARERGYRSVSVDAATALVPRASSLRAEYRRKVRTMARGLGTLHYKRHLLNPLRYGGFALRLVSHKLCRWLFQLSLLLLLPAVLVAGLQCPQLLPWIGAGVVVLVGTAAAAWWWPAARPMPRSLAMPGYFVWANLAGLMAWLRFFRREYQPTWEPTRRPPSPPSSPHTTP